MFDVKQSDTVFLASPFTFDPSVVETFIALHAGAKLLIVSDKLKTQPELLSEILFDKYHCTFLQVEQFLIKTVHFFKRYCFLIALDDA